MSKSTHYPLPTTHYPLILMIKLLINRRLTLSYSLLIPIVYNVIRKGSISEELVLLLVQNCKLPCLLFGYLL